MKLVAGALAVWLLLGATDAGDLAKTMMCSENYVDDIDFYDNFEECMREGGYSSLDIACVQSRMEAGDESGMYECLGFDYQKYIQYQVPADLDAATCVQKELLRDFSSVASFSFGGDGYEKSIAAAVNKCYPAPQFSEAKRECFQNAYQMEDLTEVEYLLATCVYNLPQPDANGADADSFFDLDDFLDDSLEIATSYEFPAGDNFNLDSPFDFPVEEFNGGDLNENNFKYPVNDLIGTDFNENDLNLKDITDQYGGDLNAKKRWD